MQELMQVPVAGGGISQLVARASAIRTRPISLVQGVAYKRGMLVYAADLDSNFSKVTHTTAIPAATDVIAVVPEDFDLSAAGAPDKNTGWFSGEFVESKVFGTTDGTLSAGEKSTLRELLLKQGINLVVSGYNDVTDAI
jgi:hypothetical protein